MNYTLVGAPDTKTEVAEKLRAFLNEGECDNCYRIESNAMPRHDEKGFLTDYRSEARVAAERSTYPSGKDQNVIFKHSLVDNVAYIGLHVKDLLEEDTNNPNVVRWTAVFNVALQMLIDSKQPDHYLYIPYTGDDQNHIDLDEALQDVLVTLDLPYTEVDPSEEASTWITS